MVLPHGIEPHLLVLQTSVRTSYTRGAVSNPEAGGANRRIGMAGIGAENWI